MKVGFEGKCAIELDFTEGKRPVLKEVKIDLNVSKNIDKRPYFADGLPNKDGAKVLRQCFIQGLVTVIRHAHKEGFENEAENMRYIIDELQRSFVAVVYTGESTYPENFE